MTGNDSNNVAEKGNSNKTPPSMKQRIPKLRPYNIGNLLQEDDCDRPACDDTVSALKTVMNMQKQSQMQRKQQSSSKTVTTRSDVAAANNRVECPPGSQELGRSTWALLHSMAAWYPDLPRKEDEKQMKQFFNALATFYPCTYCAEDFRQNLKEKPVITKTRTDLCVWLCEQHNIVNEKLGKPTFDCDIDNLDRRWRKNPEC